MFRSLPPPADTTSVASPVVKLVPGGYQVWFQNQLQLETASRADADRMRDYLALNDGAL